MFPIADDSQFLRPDDCVFFEICRDKVAAYNAAFHMQDLHSCARHVDEDLTYLTFYNAHKCVE